MYIEENRKRIKINENKDNKFRVSSTITVFLDGYSKRI
jgi:hypothetical protein